MSLQNHSNQNDHLQQAINSFKRKVEITKDARFQSSLRLKKRSRVSTYVISLLSLYVILLSFAQNFLEGDDLRKNILFVLTVILSIFVIIVTWMEASGNFFQIGAELHKNARKISDIHYSLTRLDPNADNASGELENIQKSYQKSLDDCAENHDNVDYYRVRATKPNLFSDYYSENKFYNWTLRRLNWVYVYVGEYSWLFLPACAVIASTIGALFAVEPLFTK